MNTFLFFSAVIAAVIALRMWFQAMGRVVPGAAHQLVRRGALLIDVRGRSDFGSKHLPNARNIPLAELDKRMRELRSRGAALVVYSDTGGESARATWMLRKAGYTNVHDLGPMSRWSER